jgi:hypothetical protein
MKQMIFELSIIILIWFPALILVGISNHFYYKKQLKEWKKNKQQQIG